MIVATYIGFLCHLIKGVPASISETYYRGGQGWFSAVMVAAGFLTAIGVVHITPEPWQFLGFLQGAGLVFVGAAAHFKSPSVRPVHVAADIRWNSMILNSAPLSLPNEIQSGPL